jgi:serine/threonine protein kinase
VTAQLQHPSIVPIYDIGQTKSGEIYYTMRLVRGPTLAQLVDAHRAQIAGGDPQAPEGWTQFKLLQVFVTVCRAVSYAHDRGVVHRDLKPSNVMIGAYSEVNILDWGLAKVVGRSARDGWTGAGEPTPGDRFWREGVVQAGPEHLKMPAGTIAGTPAFMAPEQAGSCEDQLSFPADVYGLGAILYYILTGRPPRNGTPADVVEQLVRRAPPPLPRTFEPSISSDLNQLCMSALESDPSARLGSAVLLADAVESYLEGRSLVTPRTQDAEFLRGYSSRHYRRPSVTVDVVVMTMPVRGAARVALLHRNKPPFVGRWACPGTFVRLEEPLEETAKRVLRDKVGDPSLAGLDQIGAFG